MNIKEAKQEVKNTITAYLKKDDMGSYEIAIERQRPILLMGPPGIGKTAIMEQVAKELGIPAGNVLVCSTGVIGQAMELAPFEAGVPMAATASASVMPSSIRSAMASA